jgi:hypothetical protein
LDFRQVARASSQGFAVYGVIFVWRVKPEKLADHAEVMRATLRAERERCPEVLVNLTFGPAADGTCAEIQVYADEAISRGFPDRVQRDDAELANLWSRFGDLCDPNGWQTLRFENLDFLDDSFARAAAGFR